MKRLFFVTLISIAYALTSCDKINNAVQDDTDDQFNELYQRYDFSEVDTENAFYYDTEDNGNLPIEYKYIKGWKSIDNTVYWALVIFDESTKKPVYEYIDYGRPISFTAYGEDYYYNNGDYTLAMLRDRLVILAQYGYNRSDYIQVYQNGNYIRNTINNTEIDISDFKIINWGRDAIFFYNSSIGISYIYAPSTSKVIFQGPHFFVEKITDSSLYLSQDFDPYNLMVKHL